MGEKIKMPMKGHRDVDVEIGTKKEALWTDILEEATKELAKINEDHWRITEFQTAIIKMAKEKIKEENK